MIDNLINKLFNYLIVNNDEEDSLNLTFVENLNKSILKINQKIKTDSFYFFTIKYKNIYYDSDINMTTKCISKHINNSNLENLIKVSYTEDNLINQNIITLIKDFKSFISVKKLRSKNLFLYEIFNQFNIKWLYNVLIYDKNGAIAGNLLLTWTNDNLDFEMVEIEIKTVINYIQNQIKNS